MGNGVSDMRKFKKQKAMIYISMTFVVMVLYSLLGGITQVQAASTYGTQISTGYCGEKDSAGNVGTKVTWTLYDSNADGNNKADVADTLVISGTGKMADYDNNGVDLPWYDRRGEITRVVVSSGVTSIGNLAFFACANATSAEIASSITSIGEAAFYGWSSLTEITLPTGLTNLGKQAFQGCSLLTSIRIPAGVTTLDNTFLKCSSLESVTFAEGSQLQTLNNNVFSNCSALKAIQLPDSVTGTIGASAFYYCSGLTSIEIPEGVTGFGTSAFSYCSSLDEVIINSTTISTIGTGVFSNSNRISTLIYNADLSNSATTLKSLGLSNVKTKMTYKENSDGTVSVTVMALPENATEVSLPKSIGGKTIKELSYDSGIKVDTENITISCTTHNPVDAKNSSGHGKVCTVCKTVDTWNAHDYSKDGVSCSCGFVKPFVMKNQPVSGEVSYGDSATLSVNAQVYVGATLTYQWYENGKEITGATSSSYSIPVGKQTATYKYKCKITCNSYKVDGVAVSGSDYIWSETSDVATITVVKKKITVQADNKSKTEGRSNPKLTYTVPNDVLVADDTTEDWEVTLNTAATVNSAAGTYSITGTIESDNYEVTVTPGKLTIYHDLSEHKDATGHGKKCNVCGAKSDWETHVFDESDILCSCGFVTPIVITSKPESQESSYGYTEGISLSVEAETMSGATEFTYQWYENGNPIEKATAKDYTVPTGKSSGTYVYECKMVCEDYLIDGESVSGGDYTYCTSVSATVAIKKKHITIKIENKEKTEGEENPAFTYVIAEGELLDGDTMADWEVSFSTAATKASSAGTYAITGAVTSDNYEVTILPGVLTIKEKAEDTDSGNSGEESVPQNPNDTENSGSTGDSENVDIEYTGTLKKGDKIRDTQNKAMYQITKVGTVSGKVGAVKYVKPLTKKIKKVTIPTTITVNGIKYKVTEIAANAFKNCKKLTKVIIGKNVSKIGKKAFYNCKKLKTITIKTKKLTTKNVGSQAFKKIHSKATIKVPSSKLKAYKKLLKKKGVGAKVKIKKA